VNEDRIHGSIKSGFGKAESRLGGLFGDSGAQARGSATEAQGTVQEIYGRAVEHAGKVGDDLQSRIRSQPYAALGVAAGLALIVGLMMGRGGTKVVYVRK